MHLVERVASGIPRMQEAMREAKLPKPEFHTERMFTAVFKRKYSITNDTVNSKEQEVLNLLRQQTGLNATEIAQKLGKSIPTVKRYLSSLAKQSLIEFRGTPKTRGYYLINQN